ncbi:MAG: hypothetical protein AB1797_09495 [bacterium]
MLDPGYWILYQHRRSSIEDRASSIQHHVLNGYAYKWRRNGICSAPNRSGLVAEQ